MVAPITPRNRTVSRYSGGKRWYYRVQNGYAQAFPIDRSLPYYGRVSELKVLKNDQINVGDDSSTYHAPGPDLSSTQTAVYNMAYERLKGRIPSAGLGVNLVEYRQARDMIATRGTQFAEIALLLARRKFATAGQKLGCYFYDGRPPRRNRHQWVLPDFARRSNSSLGNLWLEWHFGVSPMIGDVQDAAEVLTDPLPNTRIHGSGEDFVRKTQVIVDTANPGTHRDDIWSTRVRYALGCDVAVSNPNVALANQLGVLNPANLLWEIIPFSFVVDWVVNVGDWLQGFSDFAGMSLERAHSTSDLYTFHRHLEVLKPWGTGVTYTGERFGSLRETNRSTTISGPILAFKPLKLPSLSRAATIWSLAFQQLQRHR